MKKVLLFLLLTVILLSSVSCGGVSEAHYLYTETDDGIVITGITAYADELAIPAEIDGKSVIAIEENAFYRNERLKKLTIPASVRSVGGYAFADCPRLNSVIFERGGAVVLNESVFEGCSLLQTVRLNGSVISIGDGAFRNCGRIFTLKMGKEVEEIGFEAFKGCERTLFQISSNSMALEYAEENHLATSFGESVYYTYLQLISIAFGLVLLFVGYKIYKKRRKKT